MLGQGPRQTQQGNMQGGNMGDKQIKSARDFFLEDGKIDWAGLFEHYDLDGSGFLERNELRQFFLDQGVTNERELDRLVNEIDIVEQDGKISFGEFVLYHMNKEE